jgi:glutathione S-transferase
MRLYWSANSPYARKVLVLLHELDLIARVEVVPTAGGPLDPGTLPLALNPLGKIPTLERDDGPALYDSRVICRYLDALAGGRFYPAGVAQWETLTLEATSDGIMDAALLMVYEDRLRPEDRRYPVWVETQWSKVSRALDVIEGRWLSHLNGPPDIAQIAVGCATGYLDLRHGARNWRDGRPGLAAWDAAYAMRPAMVATRPPG